MRMKKIDGYDHLFICDNGEVWNNKKQCYLKGSHTKGYKYVHLKREKIYKVHRLVAQAFIPNPDNLPDVNHINGIKDDNRVENLEWCSKSQNQNHAVKTGLRKVKSKYNERYIYENPKSPNKPYRFKKGNIQKSFKTLEEALEYRKVVLTY